MLAQWVPLHAVSCSNLIETGGCAESREIPLRVTQTCFDCWLARDGSLLSLSFLRLECALSFYEPSDRRLLFVVYLTLPQRSRSFLLIFRCTRPSRSLTHVVYSRSRITILGTPAFFRANLRPREIADDRLTGCHRELRSRHLTTRMRSCRQDCPTFQRRFTIMQSTCRGVIRVEHASRPLSQAPHRTRLAHLAHHGLSWSWSTRGADAYDDAAW